MKINKLTGIAATLAIMTVMSIPAMANNDIKTQKLSEIEIQKMIESGDIVQDTVHSNAIETMQITEEDIEKTLKNGNIISFSKEELQKLIESGDIIVDTIQ